MSHPFDNNDRQQQQHDEGGRGEEEGEGGEARRKGKDNKMNPDPARQHSRRPHDNDDQLQRSTYFPRKRLRSSQTDLKIHVGPLEQVYHYHSQILAMHSDYIDSMLASPMAEAQCKTLSFPEIPPQHWELMMEVLWSVPTRDLTVQEVQSIAPYYDKYCFVGGLKACDRALKNYLAESPVPPQDFINVLAFSKQYHLEEALATGLCKLKQLLGNDMGRLALTFHDLTRIVPFLREYGGEESVGATTGAVATSTPGVATGTAPHGNTSTAASIPTTAPPNLWPPVQKLLRPGTKTTKARLLQDPSVFALLFQKAAIGFNDRKSLRYVNRAIRVANAGMTELNGLYHREPRTVGSYTPYIKQGDPSTNTPAYAVLHRTYEGMGGIDDGKYWSIGRVIRNNGEDDLEIDPVYISDYEPTSLPPRVRWQPVQPLDSYEDQDGNGGKLHEIAASPPTISFEVLP